MCDIFETKWLPTEKKYDRRLSGKEAGFSLIEFMVASAIGVIVLLAAGTTYFTTQRLNTVAMARLAAQQDVRNTANLIVADARQAGTFGCASLGEGKVSVAEYKSSDQLISLGSINDSDKAGALGVKKLTKGELSGKFSGFTPASAGLMFVYGTGFAALSDYNGISNVDVNATQTPKNLKFVTEAGSPVATAAVGRIPFVISSCQKLNVLAGNNKNVTIDDKGETITVTNSSGNIKMNAAMTDASAFLPSQTTLSRLTANVYVIGTVSGATGTDSDTSQAVTGLFRFSLMDDGSWSPPQLMIAGAKTMDMLFGYVQSLNCSKSSTSELEENFIFKDAPAITSNYSNLPSIIRLTLSMDQLSTTGDSEGAGTPKNTVIDVTVRGGNVCANRALES